MGYVGYDIYDTDTANLVDSVPTEEEALVLVYRAIKEEGVEAIRSWAVGRSDHDGKALYGKELIERAIAISS